LVGCLFFSIFFGLADILWGFSTSSLWRTARQHYMTETQHIDTVEERLMHGVVFSTRGDFIHTALLTRLVLYLIKDLMSRVFFSSDVYFYFITSLFIIPTLWREMWMTKQLSIDCLLFSLYNMWTSHHMLYLHRSGPSSSATHTSSSAPTSSVSKPISISTCSFGNTQDMSMICTR
jgi:hypothetical protein